MVFISLYLYVFGIQVFFFKSGYKKIPLNLHYKWFRFSPQVVSSNNEGDWTADKRPSSAASEENEGPDKVAAHVERPQLPKPPSETSCSNSNLVTVGSEGYLNRLTSLTNAFNLLSKEKTRLEEAYVKDKKGMREEFDKNVNELSDRLEDMNSLNEKLETQIRELKSKVREQQSALDEQNETSSIMLKELQILLSEERQKVTKQHARIQDLEGTLTNERALKSEALKYQSKVASLEKELEEVAVRLKASETKANETPHMITELQKEMQEIRASHKVALIAEQNKAKEAELHAQSVEESAEERICNLESKLSQFTETLSQYESVRVESSTAINSLKERVAQLDLENTLLSQAMGKQSQPDSNLSVEGIEFELQRYRELYKVARTKAGLSVLDDINEDNSENSYKASYDKAVAELSQLKEEFERYKSRAQNLLRSKVRDGENAEIERQKGVIKSLKTDLNALHDKKTELENEVKSTKEIYEMQIKVLKQEHSTDMEKREREHTYALKELEEALVKQRERMADLLCEKEKEINELHHHPQGHFSLEKLSPNLNARATSDDSLDTVNDSVFAASGSPTSNIPQFPMHVRETLARKEAELKQAKKERVEAQKLLKSFSENAMMKEMKFQEELESLSNQIIMFRLRESREGSNIEYVKNVMHRFLLCTASSDARNSMLDALLTALHFTSAEQLAVKKAQASSKWFT